MKKRITSFLVVLSFLLTSCFSSGNEENFDALWFSQDETGFIGGTSKVSIKLEKTNNKEVQVGFYESEVGGAGEMWRSAGWMASVVGSLLSEKNINQYRIDFTAGGRIDGPSAGAIMTVGLLANLLGDSVNENIAMTGTINPDGTIGPVGGIVHKLEGAKKIGKTKVLVPISQRYDVDFNTGETIDLVSRGKELEIEVKEVSTIYEAYKEITGHKLPRPYLGASAPNLPEETYNKIKIKVSEWQNRYNEKMQKIQTYSNDIKQFFTEMITEAQGYEQRANNLLMQGSVSASYSKMVEATLYAAIIQNALEEVIAITNNGLDGLLQYINASFAVTGRIDSMAERLALEEIKSINDLMALAEAYSNLGTALGVVAKGDMLTQELKQIQNQEEQIVKGVEIALYYAVSEYAIEMAEDALEIAKGLEGPKVPKVEELKNWSELLRRALEANQQYFQATVINEQAKQASIHPTQLKNALASADFSYLESLVAMNSIQPLQNKLNSEQHKAAAALGLAANGYSQSSALVAKYYSLEAQLDKENNIVGIGRDKALISMLENASAIAEENIQAAQEAKTDPVLAIFHYQTGKAYREGTLEDKLSALTEFWLASTYARLSFLLAQ